MQNICGSFESLRSRIRIPNFWILWLTDVFKWPKRIQILFFHRSCSLLSSVLSSANLPIFGYRKVFQTVDMSKWFVGFANRMLECRNIECPGNWRLGGARRYIIYTGLCRLWRTWFVATDTRARGQKKKKRKEVSRPLLIDHSSVVFR